MGSLLGCRIGAMSGGSIACAALETSSIARSVLGGSPSVYGPAQRAVSVNERSDESFGWPWGKALLVICLTYEQIHHIRAREIQH